MADNSTKTPTDDELTMTDKDSDLEFLSDGGKVQQRFEIVSESQETRRDRFRELFRQYVAVPFGIMWQDWRARVGLTIVTFYVLVGIFGPILIEESAMGEGEPLIQPFQTMEFPLGTDRTGHDLLKQTVHSTRPVLLLMFSGGLFSVTVGTFMGTLAGYKGGALDTVLNTITDTFINIPGLPLVIVLSVILEPTNPVIVGVYLAIALWAGLARSIRSQVLTLRRESFIEAAETMGVPTLRIIRKEMLPHLAPYIVINFVNGARIVLFSAVALYFLGVLPFEENNWGVTMNLAYQNGAHYRPEALHWLLVPTIATLGISVGVVLIAQSLDRVFNPRARADSESDEETEADAATTTTASMGGR